jgi:RES domain-containing protein
VTLPKDWGRYARALIEQAAPLEASCFRSVEIDWAYPADVVSGEGTYLNGGRFVRPGIHAVYGSADEETARHESAARASRLAGNSGSAFNEFPRITYVISVSASRSVDLTVESAAASAILPACLTRDDFTASQEVGEWFRSRGVQAIRFPSAIPGFRGRNLVAFRDVDPAPAVDLLNREQIVDQFRRLGKRIERWRIE